MDRQVGKMVRCKADCKMDGWRERGKNGRTNDWMEVRKEGMNKDLRFKLQTMPTLTSCRIFFNPTGQLCYPYPTVATS